MKVLDPQSAMLTNAEVLDFLKTNKTRSPDKRIGGYEPINLKDLNNVRQDFERYIKLTAPHVAAYPSPATYMNDVINRFRQCGLTKTEALMILNLGLGLDRAQLPRANGAPDAASKASHQKDSDHPMATHDDDDTTQAPTSDTVIPTDPASVETSDNYHQLALSCVVEKMDERFPGEEGELKIQQILSVLRECIPMATGR